MPRLSHTSYLVLGLIGGMGAATPYELKQTVGASLGYFWSFPHSQLYSEPDRLVGLGLLAVDQEEGGRRRKRYSITDAGREVLRAWLRDPEAGRAEVREPGLLKLFFGALADEADVTRLARARVRIYQDELRHYESLEQAIADEPSLSYPYATLRLGIAWVRACLTFWQDIAERPPGGAADRRELRAGSRIAPQ